MGEDITIVLFDTETTALISNSAKPLNQQPRVIEFYGKLVHTDGSNFEDGEELEFICNPGITIPEEVSKITGLTEEDVRGKPFFDSYAPDVERFFAKADQVVAHNLYYDMFVVNCEFKRLTDEEMPTWPRTKICTVEETEWINGYRMNLTALHVYLFNEEFDKAHSARADVEAMARCFIELRKRGEI